MNAMYMYTPTTEKMRRAGEVEKTMLGLPAIISNGKWKLETVGALKKFPNKDSARKLHLELPKSTLSGPVIPYGKWFTHKVGKHVFGPNWADISFGIIPGNFWFSDYELFFQGQESPKSASSILVYADCPMWAYGGINKLATFEFAPGLYGLLIPFDFITQDRQIFTGSNVPELWEAMEYGLKRSRLAA